jgi:hypothetical protein
LTNTALKFTEGPGENRIIQCEFYGATLSCLFVGRSGLGIHDVAFARKLFTGHA